MPELETITNNLSGGYKQLEPASFMTSAELTTERRTNEALRNRWFYTANFSVYAVEEGKEILYFGGREANPILGNIDEACRQLISNKNYRVNTAEMQAIKEAEKAGLVLRLEMAELGLNEFNGEFSCFEIDTENPDKLKKYQRALAEEVYDKGQDFIENMKMLSSQAYNNTRKIGTTKIYVLNPKYVRKEAKSGAIARAGFLGSFDGLSDFVAFDRVVNGNGSLRGVSLSGSLEVAAGDETQNKTYNKPENLPKTTKSKLSELKQQEKDIFQKISQLSGDGIEPSARWLLLELE